MESGDESSAAGDFSSANITDIMKHLMMQEQRRSERELKHENEKEERDRDWALKLEERESNRRGMMLQGKSNVRRTNLTGRRKRIKAGEGAERKGGGRSYKETCGRGMASNCGAERAGPHSGSTAGDEAGKH